MLQVIAMEFKFNHFEKHEMNEIVVDFDETKNDVHHLFYVLYLNIYNIIYYLLLTN